MTLKQIHQTLFMAWSLFLIQNCSPGDSENKNLRPVKYMKVLNFSEQKTKTFTGTVEAKLESKLSFKLAGTVNKIYYKVGDSVKKGNLLAQLDSATQKITLEEARSALIQATAQFKNADLSYNRLRSLYEEGSASKSELDTAKTAVETTGAMTKAAKKKVELAQLQVDYTSIKAPADGSIVSINTEENENISAGFPVLNFASTGAPKIEIQIPEDLIPFVEKGSHANIKIKSLNENSFFKGLISEVGAASTKAASTFPVVVSFVKENEHVKAGMSSEVTLDFSFQKDKLKTVIPLSSIIDENGLKYVFVLKNTEDSIATVEKREIKISQIGDFGAELESGVQHGEELITAGVHQISNGQKVKVLENWKEK